MTEFNSPHESPPNRRGFITRVLAAALGGLVGTVPVVSGLLFFLDPLTRKRGGSGGNSFLKLPVSLDALAINGEPQLVKIVMDKVDAWNTYLAQPVGAVYLRRVANDKVVAFNQRCPHLGCAVDYKPAEQVYFCPCHTSRFQLTGEKINDIPPRHLDELDIEIRGNEIWIKFQNFRATTPEKIPVG